MTLTTLADARRRLAERTEPLQTIDVPLADAHGLRLAEDVDADMDMPPLDVSAMDGYAVRAADSNRADALRVAFEIQAGWVPEALPPGTAARIFTGAPLPSGADAVVPQEKATRLDSGAVRLAPSEPGDHVRRRGELYRRGRRILCAGTRLTAAATGLAAGAGGHRLRCIRRPTLAILATGSELVPFDVTPPPGSIRDSNTPTLRSLATESRVDVVSALHSTDDASELEGLLASSLATADVVVTSGGVSVGDFDLVPGAVERAGGEILVHRVAMRPGKPILVARVGTTWFVGLPGNPMAVVVGWRLFVRPLIEALAGDETAFDEAPVEVALDRDMSNPTDRPVFHPVRLGVGAGGRPVASPLAWLGSHDVGGAATANALGRVEPGAGLEPGATIACLPLPWRW